MIRPMTDKVLIRRDEVKVEDGELILASTSKKKPNSGIVVAVGDGHMLNSGEIIKLNINIGDHIAFQKMTGTNIYIDGVEHIILRERDILGKY